MDTHCMDTEAKTIISIASDHAGFGLKQVVISHLKDQGYNVIDLGTNGGGSVDYPDFAHKLAENIRGRRSEKGVLVCGSGVGISIAANRHNEIRAALIHDALGAKMCRQHNDANVIVFGGRMIGQDVALDCLDTFLTTEFEGGRHARRVDKINPESTQN